MPLSIRLLRLPRSHFIAVLCWEFQGLNLADQIFSKYQMNEYSWAKRSVFKFGTKICKSVNFFYQMYNTMLINIARQKV